jgi:hypothetical protein
VLDAEVAVVEIGAKTPIAYPLALPRENLAGLARPINVTHADIVVVQGGPFHTLFSIG